VGRWEGDTLVVDTRNFTPQRAGLTFGVLSGPDKRLTERIRLVDGGMSLRIDYVLEDPDYLAEPVRGHYHWTYRPDLEPSGVPCNLDNARRFLDQRTPRRRATGSNAPRSPD
jgi:hypothetical protein